MIELRTQRLLLRQPQQRDKQSLANGLNDWEVAKWLANVPYAYSVASAVVLRKLGFRNVGEEKTFSVARKEEMRSLNLSLD